MKEWQCSVLDEKRKSWAPIESRSIGRKSASRLNVNVATVGKEDFLVMVFIFGVDRCFVLFCLF